MKIVVLVLIGILVSVMFIAPFVIVDNLRKRRKESDESEKIVESEEKESVYLLDGYGPPERNDGTGVCSLLMAVYRSLKKQKAAGFRNWIPSCIERIQKGYDVPPEIALLALKKTRDELLLRNGRRLDLNELGRAILALEVETGEWN